MFQRSTFSIPSTLWLASPPNPGTTTPSTTVPFFPSPITQQWRSYVSYHQPVWCHLLLTEEQDSQATCYRSRIRKCSAHTYPQTHPEISAHLCKRFFFFILSHCRNLLFCLIEQAINCLFNIIYFDLIKQIIRIIHNKFIGISQGSMIPKPRFLQKRIQDVEIGTFKRIATVEDTATVYEALSVFVERRVSALPVVTEQGIFRNHKKLHILFLKLYLYYKITYRYNVLKCLFCM